MLMLAGWYSAALSVSVLRVQVNVHTADCSFTLKVSCMIVCTCSFAEMYWQLQMHCFSRPVQHQGDIPVCGAAVSVHVLHTCRSLHVRHHSAKDDLPDSLKKLRRLVNDVKRKMKSLPREAKQKLAQLGKGLRRLAPLTDGPVAACMLR